MEAPTVWHVRKAENQTSLCIYAVCSPGAVLFAMIIYIFYYLSAVQNIVADYVPKYFSIIFFKKVTRDISCESSARQTSPRQTIHMKDKSG